MQTKNKLFLLFLLFTSALMAQRVELKNPLTETDYAAIDKSVISCFDSNIQFRISYSNTELFDAKLTPDLPSTPENIEKLKKTLKGTNQDVDALIAISGHYAILKMRKEENEYRDKAIAICEQVLAQYPDSSSVWFQLSGIYMGALRFDEAIAAARKGQTADPKNPNFSMLIGNLFFFGGMTDSTVANYEREYQLNPDSRVLYDAMPLAYLYKFMGKVLKMSTAEEMSTITIDSVLNMPMLDEYYKKHAAEPDAEFTWKAGRQAVMISYLSTTAINDSTFDIDHKLNITELQKQRLLESENYFKSCLKGKNKSYHYFSNRLLGGTYVALNEPKKAIPYFRKAIELKPLSNSTITSNAEEDYNNLLAVAYILRDSAMYEKTILEKIRVKPAINPNPEDYVTLGGVYLAKKNKKKALEWFTKAVETDPTYADGLCSMALYVYLEGDYTKAETYINKAYAADKNCWKLYIVYGALLMKKKDIVNAYETFKIAKRLHDREWIQDELLSYFDE